MPPEFTNTTGQDARGRHPWSRISRSTESGFLPDMNSGVTETNIGPLKPISCFSASAPEGSSTIAASFTHPASNSSVETLSGTVVEVIRLQSSLQPPSRAANTTFVPPIVSSTPAVPVIPFSLHAAANSS